MIAALLIARLLSLAARGQPVVEQLPTGEVDWTAQRLVVRAAGEKGSGAMGDMKAVEQAARARLAPRLEAAARSIGLSGELTAGELMDGGDAVARLLGENLLRWRVSEARYFTSGRVELTAELALQPWLSPALVSVAAGREDSTLESQHTGVLIDARGTGLRPSFSPRVLDVSGEPVYSASSLSPESAGSLAPAVWVTDPIDEAAAERAGAAPLFIRADGVRAGRDILLAPRDGALLRVLATETDLLARGRVVVVLDP